MISKMDNRLCMSVWACRGEALCEDWSVANLNSRLESGFGLTKNTTKWYFECHSLSDRINTFNSN